MADVDGELSSWRAFSGVLGLGEPQLALREGLVSVPRLVRASQFAGNGSSGSVLGEREPRFDPSGTVLVTGGTGGLGAMVARHLVERYEVRHLLLVSRSGGDAEGAAMLVEELSRLGARVAVKACDVADRCQVEDLLAGIAVEHPLRSVVHAAGALDDGVIDSLSSEQVERVFAPKVDGAWILHELTAEMDLRDFVLFSSVGGVLGGPGQGNYAAANGFLDGLAVYRRALGLAGTSIAWGLWSQESGMKGRLREVDLARVQRSGVVALSPEEGLRLFDVVLQRDEVCAIPVRLDLRALASQARLGVLPAIMSKCVRVSLPNVHERSRGSLASRLAGMTSQQREGVVLELVRADTASVLGHSSPEAVSAEESFKDMGLDSLGAVELRNRLTASIGMRLSATLVFDHPSPAELARHLLKEIDGAPGAVKRRAIVASTTDEPIAIVGMSCRYPGGVSSPEDLWQLVSSGVDAVGDFPTDRGWELDELYDPDPEQSGKSYTREGGFVYDAAEFDAAFFGIGPREGLAMDPQQRLLLETSWEAIEYAGIDPSSLRGSATGVFAGVMYHDYVARLAGAVPGDLERYLGTGSAGSVASGRVAYTFGFEGPAVTVDTACSSSLVALHWACGALRSGECSLALAGGVTVLSTPGVFIDFSRQRGLAVDGRCKSFSDDADGTGWSEGVGVLLVERLSDAQRNGHTVLGLVRGSAVNQDGASNGLTAPNGPSQQRVILDALDSADLSPEDVDAVEGHGTGTTLGDPIEAQALLATYGQHRIDERPLWLGSIKSNIGHTQAAAGVAGVIKMIMALQNNRLPRTIHADQPSKHVDWSSGAVELLGEERRWESVGGVRRAGVSSFGISGTNAHVIIEEPPVVEGSLVGESVGVGGGSLDGVVVGGVGVGLGVVPWVLSGRGEGGLVGQAGRLREFVSTTGDGDGGGVGVLDVGLSLVGRSVFERRGVVLGSAREGLLDGLGVLASGGSARGVVSGVVSPGGLAFLFTGQGSQRVGMGRGLWDEFPVFRNVLGEVCEHFDVLLGCSLRDVMFGSEGSEGSEGSGVEGEGEGVGDGGGLGLGHTSLAQAGLFALEVGLFRLVEGLGVRPDYLLGHSVGEIVAAHVAGVFSLGDACRIVEARGRLMGALPAGGVMVAVEAGEDEVVPELERFGGRVCLAAVNTPRSLVISGDEDVVLEFAGVWEERGRKTKRLEVSHAFHSARMDGMLGEFKNVLEGVSFSEPRLPIISNVTGQPAAASEICTPEYWVSHARSTVRFADGVRWLEENGVDKYLELGPDGTLSAITQENHEASPPVVMPVLREDHPENTTFLEALAHAWVAGTPIDWSTIFHGTGAKRVGLPAYAFQRERYWLESARGVSDLASVGQGAAEHPLLGAMVGLAGDGWLFTGRLSLQNDPWLADHVVFGHVVLAGTVFLELALCAGNEIGCEGVGELTLHAPLVLPQDGGVQIQVRVGEPDQTGDRQITISSRPDTTTETPDESWTTHAQGTLTTNTNQTHNHDDHTINTQEWPPVGSEAVDIDGFYDRLADIGLEYGPAFQGLRAVWKDGNDLYAEVALPAGLEGQAESFGVHPALLDAALHALAFGVSGVEERGAAMLPFSWSDVVVVSGGASSVRVCLTLDGGERASLTVVDEDGGLVASVGSLALRELSQKQLRDSVGTGEDSLFGVNWTPISTSSVVERGVSLVVVGGDSLGLTGDMGVDGVSVRSYPDMPSFRDAMKEDEAPDCVLMCCPPAQQLAMGPQSTWDIGVLEAVHDGTNRVLGAMQEWLADERLDAVRLVVLTRGAVSVGVGEGIVDLGGSAVWGLVRSAQTESPARFTLLDVDSEEESSGGVLIEAINASVSLGEPQLAIRAGKTLVPRLGALDTNSTLRLPLEASEWCLDVGDSGTLDDFELVRSSGANVPLQAGQIRVEMRAAGLNFRDVLIALGAYPDEASVGGEGAGVVVEVGEGVQDLSPGDRVMGFFEGAFSTVALTDRRVVVPMPEGWSFAQAASVPIAFCTAYYGLVDLARLRAGERLLVHAAAGGVGIAAVQLAKHLGAEIFGTASPPKWGVLEEMGLDERHISSSRTLEFKESFLEETDGHGMNVVLDCLAREFVDASLDLLVDGGRFIEMGKTDIRDPENVAANHPGVIYQAFDVMEAGPERLQEMLGELLTLFERGVLKPLPVQGWDMRHAPEAFRYMSQARHVGKNVLMLPVPLTSLTGTVLITGGTGGLGTTLARHLVAEHGVRHLVLASRRGSGASGATELAEELQELGARVNLVACDVSDREQVEELLSSIPAEHPLRVVVHAAGVLDDGLVSSLTPESVDSVLAAKADGAWHLHKLTEHMDLDAFVLFSSIAATLGSPGQGNYAAANAFLDALALHRRSNALQSISMGWGQWELETGITEHLGGTDLARMARAGILALSNEQGLQLFDAAYARGEAMVIPAGLDRGVLRARARNGELPALLHTLAPAHARSTDREAASLERQLRGLSGSELKSALLELVCSQTASVLGHASHRAIEAQQGFKDLGLDSLGAVELRNGLNAATGLRLTTTVVFDYPSPIELADYLLEEIGGGRTRAVVASSSWR